MSSATEEEREKTEVAAEALLELSGSSDSTQCRVAKRSRRNRSASPTKDQIQSTDIFCHEVPPNHPGNLQLMEKLQGTEIPVCPYRCEQLARKIVTEAKGRFLVKRSVVGKGNTWTCQPARQAEEWVRQKISSIVSRRRNASQSTEGSTIMHLPYYVQQGIVDKSTLPMLLGRTVDEVVFGGRRDRLPSMGQLKFYLNAEIRRRQNHIPCRCLTNLTNMEVKHAVQWLVDHPCDKDDVEGGDELVRKLRASRPS